MGIRSALFNRGKRVASAVAGAKTVGRSSGGAQRAARQAATVGRSSGARNASDPLGLSGFIGNPYGRGRPTHWTSPYANSRIIKPSTNPNLGKRPTWNNGPSAPRAPQSRIPKGQPGAGRYGPRPTVDGRGVLDSMGSLRPSARPGRMRRMGAFAKKHPLALGGAGIAVGYRMSSQDTGPAVTTTNTTGVYGM